VSREGARLGRALIVDPEPQLARVLRVSLGEHGYEAETAATGKACLDAAARHPPAVVLLSLNLPDLSGVDVIRSLRRRSQAPIIVLAEREQGREQVAALDAGADDYVIKPFDMDELLARIRAVTRRDSRPAAPARLAVGQHTLDLARREVSGTGGHVELTPVEWEIVEVLARHAGRLVTQAQLLTEVGGREYLREGGSLRVLMSRLRHKLEEDPARPRHLITEPGLGYRLTP
jgi:two-component system, OmpR family, KDP operon response regulator KdpE